MISVSMAVRSRFLNPMRTCGLLVLLVVAAGCGGGGAPVSTTAGTTTPTDAAVTETNANAAPAPCGAADILPVLKQELGPSIVSADVVRCRNDYARVSAARDMSACPPTCYDSAEVYLQWTGGRWRILDVGTGIPCEDTTTLPPLNAQDRRACRELGYPQPAILATPTFQMPSGNIGCALSGTALRCDILSGLKPEPDRPCELDWVGLVLPPDGAAEPNCAGDTIYDQDAQTLAYGDIWHRADFWCQSEKAGLHCFNPVGEGGFELAREGWTAG
jgi:hypothetical protein